MMIADNNNRILRVQIPGWVLHDRASPPPPVGEVIEEMLVFVSSDEAPSPRDETIRAVARPLYGHTPSDHSDNGLRWPVALTGDGWSAGWSADRLLTGAVELHGRFVADIGGRGVDDAVAVRGRVCRVQVIDVREGEERLVDPSPAPDEFWSHSQARSDDGFAASGVLIDLDLDDVPAPHGRDFFPGSVSIDGSDVWVMDRSNPILVHIDTANEPPAVTDYLLPLTIEPPTSGTARIVHADGSACWITSDHDVHRCERTDNGGLSVERVAIPGGGGFIVDGRLIVFSSNTPTLHRDRRYGIIRKDPDRASVRIIDRNGTVTPVDDPVEQTRLTAEHRNQDRPRVEGRRHPIVDGTVGIVVPGGSGLRVDIGERTRGIVRWAQYDPGVIQRG